MERSWTILGGVRRRVTVLFADIRGYIAIAEQSPAENVMAMLNDYFPRMVAQIARYEGHLDKFIGDAVMAVFGAPVAHDDDPLRAVLTAMGMRRELWQLNRERIVHGLAPLETGIGISSGEAAFGNVGSVEHLSRTVIGDAVNVAFLLERLTKKYDCKVLFNETVHEHVKAIVPCVDLGVDRVEGRAAPIRVFGVHDDWIASAACEDLLVSRLPTEGARERTV